MPMTLRFGWAETRSENPSAELETRTLFFVLTTPVRFEYNLSLLRVGRISNFELPTFAPEQIKAD